jgi:hypothetical protein
MRLPRPRFSVRRMMVVVAIVGIALGLDAWKASRAAFFGQKGAGHMQAWLRLPTDAPLSKTRYHLRLASKYYRAYRSPWLPVEPDPPEPK